MSIGLGGFLVGGGVAGGGMGGLVFGEALDLRSCFGARPLQGKFIIGLEIISGISSTFKFLKSTNIPKSNRSCFGCSGARVLSRDQREERQTFH